MGAPDACDRRIARGGWAEDAALQRCTFPLGPRNTWSNAAYAVAGLAVWGWDQTPAALGFLVAMTVLALGSGLYHGLKTAWANRLDWLGIWAVFGALIAHAIAPDTGAIGWIMASTALVGGVLLVYGFRQIGANALIGLMLVMAALPALWGGGWPWALASFAAFALGKACWLADKHRWAPMGLWGHAAWHVTTAVAFALMYVAQTALRGG